MKDLYYQSSGTTASEKMRDSLKAVIFKKFQWPMFILGPVSGALLYLFFISFVKDDKAHKAEVERKLKDRREALAGSESASVIR
ncbi:MAG: hypothetical protein ACOX45_04190 [Acutalibacteraceae bacterium]